MAERMPGPSGAAAGMLAASMAVGVAFQDRSAGGGERRPRPGITSVWATLHLAAGLDGLIEAERSVLDLVRAVVGQRRVAVLVDRVGAEHALAVLGGEQRLEHVGLVAGLGALDRVQGQVHRLVAVDRVRAGLDLAVLLFERVEELLARRRVLVGRERRDRALGARVERRGDAALLRVHPGALADAVRAVQLRVRPERGGEVLRRLDRVARRHTREDEAVRALRLGLLGQRAVVRRLRVDALVHDDREAAGVLGRDLDVLPEALAVDLLVVDLGDLGAAVLLHQRDEGRGLDRVDRHDPRIGARAGRVVLVRIARLRPGLVRGQADAGVGGRDLRHAGLVQDRDRDRARAR